MLLSLWLIVPPPPPLHAHARALSLCDRSSFSMLHLCCLRAGGSMVGSALSLGDSLVLSLTPATHRTWSSTSPSALVSLSLSLSFLSVSGHSVATCCNLLADLCSMLPPPLRAECYLRLVFRGRAHHDNNADAAHIVVARKQNQAALLSVCVSSLFLAREQSTGLATAGAIRPLLRRGSMAQ